MRKLFLFVFSTALVLGGATMIVFALLEGHKIPIMWFEGAGVMIFLGGYLLWTDFIKREGG